MYEAESVDGDSCEPPNWCATSCVPPPPTSCLALACLGLALAARPPLALLPRGFRDSIVFHIDRRGAFPACFRPPNSTCHMRARLCARARRAAQAALYYINMIIPIIFTLLWIYLFIYVQFPLGILEVLLFWFLNPWWDLMMLTGFAWANAAWQNCAMCDKAQCGGECGCAGK